MSGTDTYCYLLRSDATVTRAVHAGARTVGVLLLAGIVIMFPLAALAADETPESQADNIKAIFVYKITGYVTWPETDADTFTVAVLGKSSLLAPLQEIAAKRKVGDKPLIIKECAAVKDISGAQMLLIAPAMENYLEALLEKARSEKILTIANTPGFAEKGVAINLVVIENRVCIEINQHTLKQCEITLHAQLADMAKKVEEPGQNKEEGQPE